MSAQCLCPSLSPHFQESPLFFTHEDQHLSSGKSGMISFEGSEEELDLMWNWTSQWKAELKVKPCLRLAKRYTFLKRLGICPKLELDLVQLSSPGPQDGGQMSQVPLRLNHP